MLDNIHSSRPGETQAEAYGPVASKWFMALKRKRRRAAPAPSCTGHLSLSQHQWPAYGLSHWPDSAERKTASITDIFLIASSTGTGTSPPSRIALENTSP